jgi:hypothetical protein
MSVPSLRKKIKDTRADHMLFFRNQNRRYIKPPCLVLELLIVGEHIIASFPELTYKEDQQDIAARC